MKPLDDFLYEHGMHPDCVEMRACVTDFLSEMEAGLAGPDSSLRMIPTHIQAEGEIPVDKPVIAIDAGGTHFRVATVHFHPEKGVLIQDRRQYPMPGTAGPVGKVEFFRTIVHYLEPVLDRSESIGFVFSYPMEILPNRDGRLIRFCKEVQAPELEGELIGAGLNQSLRAMGKTEKRIVILNDTVATLLAGRASSGGQAYDSYVGFILGTGSNCCYVERNERITKRDDLDPEASQIVNVESGAFARAPCGTADQRLDRQSSDPGHYTFEKMFSGAYFGQLVLLTLQLAREKGLFSAELSDNLRSLTSLSTERVNDLLQRPSAQDAWPKALAESTEADREIILSLIRRLIQRAAKLTAANLVAVILKDGGGKEVTRPICITAEGTTFYQLQGLRAQVGAYLDDFLQGQRQRHYEIQSVPDATLLGAAVAALQTAE
ncbi:MAG: hexokinase [Planctomycetes bacterium]|nr:hexokinase [Planctomycetota bacterium]